MADEKTPRPAASFSVKRIEEMPRDELDHYAELYGIDPQPYKTRERLIQAMQERRQVIASIDRAVLLELVRWGRRPVTADATQEQLAQEVARVRSMRFAGLSREAMLALARLRGLSVKGGETIEQLNARMARQESIFAKVNRKWRGWVGGMISGMMGERDGGQEYQYLPGDAPSAGEMPAASARADAPPPGSSATIRDEIEEQGIFGGIAGRLKRSADTYLNQKLDEIEARIDRKLDEIDRRLAEWRDKEIASRLRILKITLWASVIVAMISLLYTYIRVHLAQPDTPPTPPRLVQPTTSPTPQ